MQLKVQADIRMISHEKRGLISGNQDDKGLHKHIYFYF